MPVNPFGRAVVRSIVRQNNLQIFVFGRYYGREALLQERQCIPGNDDNGYAGAYGRHTDWAFFRRVVSSLRIRRSGQAFAIIQRVARSIVRTIWQGGIHHTKTPVAFSASTGDTMTFVPVSGTSFDPLSKGGMCLPFFPPAAGKSICYQVPALLYEGLTLVISPLIALMQDQVAGLEAHGVKATYINSALPRREIEQRWLAAEHGKYRLLYLAPERLSSEAFAVRASRMNISLLAVDEAHCISEWGTISGLLSADCRCAQAHGRSTDHCRHRDGYAQRAQGHCRAPGAASPGTHRSGVLIVPTSSGPFSDRKQAIKGA